MVVMKVTYKDDCHMYSLQQLALKDQFFKFMYGDVENDSQGRVS